ncbi:hypothetical protein [Ligilactobacillus ruminis]|uniref:hypothetical protein n=1 Tax=Ligilactobacillus ruminis TaxID=1623 RepID=UPI00147637A4|nr:hypothetical protein [Ligilactobacillus ruminis]NME33083.1 hypothetical protein [Ligilactobacillus ruminis]
MRFPVTVAFFLNVISEAQVPMFIAKKTVAMSTAFFIDKYIGWKPVTLVMGGKPRSRT